MGFNACLSLSLQPFTQSFFGYWVANHAAPSCPWLMASKSASESIQARSYSVQPSDSPMPFIKTGVVAAAITAAAAATAIV